MTVEQVDTLIIGGGQAGIALSEHLGEAGAPHLIVERKRIAERWRTERWDTLVANGPAWHDRFPNLTFDDLAPDSFASKDAIVDYLVAYAQQVNAPIRTGIEVTALTRKPDSTGFIAQTPQGTIEAKNVVSATGPFQAAVIPPLVPADSGITQVHSAHYHNPAELPEGAVLVIGAGSSGVQIADELNRASRKVFLAVGPHARPPRRYRGKDFVWWLGALGKWNAKTVDAGQEHVTIAVSGAHGGLTIDFRDLAAQGITLLGRAEGYQDGAVRFADDLAKNITDGDADYLSVLDASDAYIAAQGLDFPEEPEARKLAPLPESVTNPPQALNLAEAGITSIVWATGYALDFGWLQVDGAFDAKGNPVHDRGVSPVPGLYFLGLAWLSRRASPFIWGVWHDAAYLAGHIAQRSAVAAEALTQA